MAHSSWVYRYGTAGSRALIVVFHHELKEPCRQKSGGYLMRGLVQIFVVVLLGVFAGCVFAQDDENTILGVWITAKGKAQVEISTQENAIAGYIIWLKEPFFPENDEQGMAGKPKIDRENPDPELRKQTVIGLQIISGFQYKGDGEWKGGTVYDPENGKTYKGKIWLTAEGTLKVRGFIGILLFGRTEEWLPVTGRRH